METKLLKKLSVKECTGLDAAALKAAAENGETILKIAGVIEGVTQKATQYGAATAFLGDFVAQNNKGEQFSANTLYLPDRGAQDQFEQKIAAVAEQGGSVQFSGEVVVAKSAKGSLGYTYIFRPLSTEEKAAKQQQLFAMLGEAKPAKQIAAKKDA